MLRFITVFSALVLSLSTFSQKLNSFTTALGEQEGDYRPESMKFIRLDENKSVFIAQQKLVGNPYILFWSVDNEMNVLNKGKVDIESDIFIQEGRVFRASPSSIAAQVGQGRDAQVMILDVDANSSSFYEIDKKELLMAASGSSVALAVKKSMLKYEYEQLNTKSGKRTSINADQFGAGSGIMSVHVNPVNGNIIYFAMAGSIKSPKQGYGIVVVDNAGKKVGSDVVYTEQRPFNTVEAAPLSDGSMHFTVTYFQGAALGPNGFVSAVVQDGKFVYGSFVGYNDLEAISNYCSENPKSYFCKQKDRIRQPAMFDFRSAVKVNDGYIVAGELAGGVQSSDKSGVVPEFETSVMIKLDHSGKLLWDVEYARNDENRRRMPANLILSSTDGSTVNFTYFKRALKMSIAVDEVRSGSFTNTSSKPDLEGESSSILPSQEGQKRIFIFDPGHQKQGMFVEYIYDPHLKSPNRTNFWVRGYSFE